MLKLAAHSAGLKLSLNKYNTFFSTHTKPKITSLTPLHSTPLDPTGSDSASCAIAPLEEESLMPNEPRCASINKAKKIPKARPI